MIPILMAGLLLAAAGCGGGTAPPPQARESYARPAAPAQMKGGGLDDLKAASLAAPKAATMPVRFQSPSYMLANREETDLTDKNDMVVKVGADITSSGPVPLRDIIKRLAAMKDMNVSWASDVDQYAPVDVDIRAEDDFFQSIDNLLRQRDYFHEVQGNTLIIKYKETRTFHIAMPFTASKFTSSVGGDVLGSSGSSTNMKGNISIDSADNTFDIWDNIKQNLDRVLEIWTKKTEQSTPANAQNQTSQKKNQTNQKKNQKQQTVYVPPPPGKGYYTIDRPLGLITVTAPRSLLKKVENYLNNLKKELYRQVTIEAKIIEVTLTDSSKTGIDWSQLLGGDSNSNFDFQMQFGNLDVHNPLGDARGFTLSAKSFSLFLNALNEQGKTNVLANPKLSVMNGQPALISVGENVTYIDSVTSTVNDGVVTYSVNTSSVMSGLGLAVIANIIDDHDVVLTLTPVTSQLNEPIEYKTFGGSNQVGLPRVKLREMSTMARVKDGDMLVVGGLIDETKDNDDQQVPLLGRLPIIGKLFSRQSRVKTRKEMLIILKPKIRTMPGMEGTQDA